MENVAGEMHELDSKKNTREDKQRFYSELIYIAAQRNYKQGWASNKYKEKFGVWPREMEVIPALPSLTTLNWIRHRNIAWAKKQQKMRQS